MEFILHFMYVNAIKDSKAWSGTTPMQLSMIGFWNLIVVWLKVRLRRKSRYTIMKAVVLTPPSSAPHTLAILSPVGFG
jgi:hypothetical protein